MPGRNQQGDYRYAYQGQEKDPETGWEAFELRMYDGRVGRWMTMDPYSQYHSPYLAMGNRPISGIDPDGGRYYDWVEVGGEMLYDSRVVSPATAEEFYGRGAIHHKIGTTYYSDGNEIILGDLGFFSDNGIINLSHDYAEDVTMESEISAVKSSYSWAPLVITGIGADFAVPEPTDLFIPKHVVEGVVFVSAVVAVKKMQDEILGIRSKYNNPNTGVQYALVAITSGYYPCEGGYCSSPTVYLNAGSVWKYGETTTVRYSGSYLANKGLIQRNEYTGTQREIKIMEKYKIYSYFLIWGTLPPGNKIFR